jgi:hypothetical protein
VAEICTICRAVLFVQRQVMFVSFLVSINARMAIGLSRFCTWYSTSSGLPMQWPRTLLYVGNCRLTELLAENFAFIVLQCSVQDEWTAYAEPQIAGCETFHATCTPLVGPSGGRRSSHSRVMCSLATWITVVVMSALSYTCWRFPYSGRKTTFEEHRATFPYVYTATRYPNRSL